jgi:hypothetical protein
VASGQDVSPGNPVLINVNLNPRQQIGNTLHLVNDRPIRKLRKESLRISACELPHIRPLKVGIRFIWKCHAAKRRFSGLTGAGDRHYRHLPGASVQDGKKVSFKHNAQIIA